MKRSRHVALFLLGAAAFGLGACDAEETDAAAFADQESCLAAVKPDGWFTAQDCNTAFENAAALHDETAPRYESRALCEEVHGPEACAPEASGGTGGGGIFMPLLTGYLIGRALGGGGAIAQPLVRSAGGGFTSPDGGARVSALNGSGKISTSAFQRAPATKGLAPMSKAQVQSRGGFGGSAATRSVGG